MGIKSKLKGLLYKAVNSNSSPSKLALSFSLGLFVAFSPIPGGHTILMFLINWLLKLNFPVLFFATSFNNPWTMVPFYALDYSFGYWFLHSFLGKNPSWIISLEKIFGSGKICLWSFIVGGSLLGIIAALVSYPIMLQVFRLVAASQKLQGATVPPAGGIIPGVDGLDPSMDELNLPEETAEEPPKMV